MCIGRRPASPQVPPPAPLPDLPNTLPETRGSATASQATSATRRLSGTGRRSRPTLLQESAPTTGAPVLLGR